MSPTALVLPGYLAEQVSLDVADDEGASGPGDDPAAGFTEDLHVLDLGAAQGLDDHRSGLALERTHDHLARADVGDLVAAADHGTAQDRLELLDRAAEPAHHQP